MALSQGVCLVCGVGVLFLGSAEIVLQCFHHRKSLASSVTIAGASFGDSAHTLTLGAVRHRAGLHLTFLSLAALSTFGNTICVLLIGDRDRELALDFPA